MADERRFLIVNADDFGRTRSTNEGIVRSHTEGIVTSTSLMVRWPEARAAAARARELPALSVGLHVDLGEWLPRNGHWALVYRVAALDDPAAVALETHRQVAEFRRLVGRDPTHLDSHQHIHVHEPRVGRVLLQVAAQLGVHLRDTDPRVRLEGGFFGQEGDGTPVQNAITPAGLCALLDDVEPGITELCCHPGAGRDSWSIYDVERASEVEALCDPSVRAGLEERGIELCSFSDVSPELRQA